MTETIIVNLDDWRPKPPVVKPARSEQANLGRDGR